jgi:hypothetical protein
MNICRDEIQGYVDENYSSSPTSTPVLQDPNPLGEGNYILEPFAKDDGHISTWERALD